MGTGAEALDIALHEKLDLLLLDIMLPDIDGFEICRQVKDTFGEDAPPIIFVSARGQQANIEMGLAAGADDYIIKPFSPRLLLERVEDLL